MPDLEKKGVITAGGKGDDRWYSYTSTTQTERLWPRLLASRADVPDVFLGDGSFDAGDFPYAILVPENVAFVNGRAVRTRQVVVALFTGRILFLEARRGAIERREHPLDQIRLLRVEDVLLSGVIEVRSPAGFSRVGFNAARDDLFRPIVTAVRDEFSRGAAGSVLPKTITPEEIRQKLETVPRIGLKFINYGMRSLPPGQEPKAVLFKESVNLKTSRRGLLRLIDRYSAPILLMKTGGEFITVEEPSRIRSRKKMEYGGIFTYIPLEKIKNVAVTDGAPSEATITLAGEDIVRYLLPDNDGFSRFL